jgi:putative endonuclease
MGFLYILQSESSGRFYIGSTDNLERRIEEHLRGKSLATRGRGPWRLVHSEKTATLGEARRRENEIKRWKSATMIRVLIECKKGESGPT